MESTTNKRENTDQIPKEDDTRGKTGQVISEQSGVEGQRKEVNVESYSKVAALGQILKFLNLLKVWNFMKNFEWYWISSR